MPRKPLAAFGFAGVQGVQDESVVVICDDGAFLVWDWREMKWTDYPAVPGTPAGKKKSS